jgi:hypothetical protein
MEANYLIEVLTDAKKKRIARVVRRMDEDTFVVKYLMPTSKLFEDKCTIYKFEENQDIVEFDSVCQWFDTNDEEEVGFKNVLNGNFVTWEDWEDLDDDYHPPSQESESEEESLIDSDEFLTDSDSEDAKKESVKK